MIRSLRIALTLALALCAAPAGAQSGTPVKLGLIDIYSGGFAFIADTIRTGFQIAVDEVYDKAATDLTAEVTKVKAANVQAILNWSIEPAQAIVIKNARQLGLVLEPDDVGRRLRLGEHGRCLVLRRLELRLGDGQPLLGGGHGDLLVLHRLGRLLDHLLLGLDQPGLLLGQQVLDPELGLRLLLDLLLEELVELLLGDLSGPVRRPDRRRTRP